MYYVFRYEEGVAVRFGRAMKHLKSALNRAKALGSAEVHDQRNRCVAAFRGGVPVGGV